MLNSNSSGREAWLESAVQWSLRPAGELHCFREPTLKVVPSSGDMCMRKALTLDVCILGVGGGSKTSFCRQWLSSAWLRAREVGSLRDVQLPDNATKFYQNRKLFAFVGYENES